MCDSTVGPYGYDPRLAKYYPNNFICTAGSTLFGECDANGTCHCKQGYTHDMVFARYRDCTLPVVLLPIFYVCQLCFTFAVLIYTFYHYRSAVSTARLVLLSNMFIALFYILYCIFQLSFDYKLTSYAFFVLYALTAALTLSASILVFSITSPLAQVAGYSPDRQKLGLQVIWFMFRVIMMIPLLNGIVHYDDINDVSKDRGWGDMAYILIFISSFELVFLSLFFIIFGSKMIKLIESIAYNLGELHQERTSVSKSYIKRVKLMIIQIVMMVPFVILTEWTLPITHLTTGYFPFQYIPHLICMSGTPMMALFITRFSVTSQSSSASNDNKINVQQGSSNKVNLEKQQRVNNISKSSKNESNDNGGKVEFVFDGNVRGTS